MSLTRVYVIVTNLAISGPDDPAEASAGRRRDWPKSSLTRAYKISELVNQVTEM